MVGSVAVTTTLAKVVILNIIYSYIKKLEMWYGRLLRFGCQQPECQIETEIQDECGAVERGYPKSQGY